MPKVSPSIPHPSDWPELETELMSNFDGAIDRAVAARMQTEQFVAGFPAWDFYARCIKYK